MVQNLCWHSMPFAIEFPEVYKIFNFPVAIPLSALALDTVKHNVYAVVKLQSVYFPTNNIVDQYMSSVPRATFRF